MTVENLTEKKEELKKLLDLFQNNIKQYMKSTYDEANTRVDFIDKFFELLDWDVRNKQGYSEDYREVVREDKVVIAGKPKAPDYSFRIGGRRIFFVEAKKPSVNIKEDRDPAFQVRRYAYTAKLSLSILTDFEELAVYDTRIKPIKTDSASTARIFYCKYDELLRPCKINKDIDNFEYLFSIFSNPSILKGSFDRYIEENKNKKGTSEVDKEILKLIDNWRCDLAKNIALRNKELDVYNLNYAIQKIINRIIFLRIAEDRNMEDYGTLQSILKEKEVYKYLLKIFDNAEIKYNSGLFDGEKWLNNLVIDDKILNTIINSFYYPECPYEFSILPIEILGNAYEQFLGKKIRLTASHQAKIEEKLEVRKAGGVYYTPQYIVDYIVENTVGVKIKRNKPEDIANLKIIDPACGSGSFLVRAYDFLLKHHIKYYTQKSKIQEALKKGKIYQVDSTTYYLSTEKKQKILLNNIYGLDIDEQAVEVTKLSLLLKLMENENTEGQGMLFKHSELKILPDLSNNIKCGNSLISNDFYDDKDLSLFSKDEMRKVNTFDWDNEFSDIFKKGGFDVVIGNPPYVDIKRLSNYDVKYIFKKYKHANNRINLFASFIEKSFDIVKNNFYFSMIVPTALLAQDSYKSLREWIESNYQIEIIIRLPNEIFGDSAGEVKVDTMIFIFSNNINNKTELIAYSGYDRINEINKNKAHIYGFVNQNNWSKNSDKVWAINLTDKQSELLLKMEGNSKQLEEIVLFSLGLTPYDKYKGHTQSQIKNKVFHSDFKKDDTFKKLLAGNDVRRYFVNWNGNQWISYGPWLGASREPIFFTSKRILVKQIIDWTDKRIWAALADEELYNTQNAFNLLKKTDIELVFILGIINSKLLSFYHRKRFLDEFKMRFQKILIKDCRKFPIYNVDFDNTNEKEIYEKIINYVSQILIENKEYYKIITNNDKKIYQQKINLLDEQIDKLVYELYGLTEEEIKIVEES